MSNSSNQVAKKQSSQVPAFMQDAGDMGVDSIGTEDVVTPRIKIAQKMSQAKDQNDKLRDGQLYHSLEFTSFGNDVEVFALLTYKTKIWFSDSQTLVGYEYFDKKSGNYNRYGLEMDAIMADKARYAEGSDTYNYMMILATELEAGIANGTMPNIYIYSASSASSKAAKQLNGKLKMNATRRIPIYLQFISFGTIKQSFDKGDAFMPVFTFPRLANKDEFTALQDGFKHAQTLMGNAGTHDEGTPESTTDEDPFTI